MEYMAVVKQVGILGIIIFAGFVSVKTGYLDGRIKDSLSKIIVKLVLPCLIISSISSKELEPELMGDVLKVFLMTAFCMLVMYIIGTATAKLLKIPEETVPVHKLLSCLGNIIFIGYPIIMAMYGDDGFFYAIIYWLINDMFLWTFGILILQKEKPKSRTEYLKKLINPNTIAFLTAVIMLIFGIKLPPILGDAVADVGNLTVSLSMLFVGMALAGIDAKNALKKWWVFIVAPVKMVLLPILFIFIFRSLGIKELLYGVVVLEAAMPAQTVMTIMARETDSDFEYAAVGLFVTTLLSLVTLPVVCYFISILQ